MLEMLILLVCGSILVSGVLAVLLSNLMAAMVSGSIRAEAGAASATTPSGVPPLRST